MAQNSKNDKEFREEMMFLEGILRNFPKMSPDRYLIDRGNLEELCWGFYLTGIKRRWQEELDELKYGKLADYYKPKEEIDDAEPNF